MHGEGGMEGGRGDWNEKNTDLIENLKKVLIPLIKSLATSLCSFISYVAMVINAARLQLSRVISPPSMCLSTHTQEGERGCSTRKHQSGFRSGGANRSERFTLTHYL